MNAMPLPFEDFQGKGFPLDFSSSSSSSASSDSSPLSKLVYSQKGPKEQSKNCYVGCEPTSVLDARRSPSPPTSSSTTTTTTTTLSSSLNSGDAVAASLSGDKPSLSLLGEAEELLLLEKHQKCGGVGIMEDWESVLSEASPGQEHSILRLIMGDVDDPSLGLNKLLQASAAAATAGAADVEDFNAGFGVVEDHHHHQEQEVGYGGFEALDHHNNNNLLPVSFSPAMSQSHHSQVIENFSSQMVVNQNQAHFGQHSTAGFLTPLTYAHFQNQVVSPPPKRLNTGGVVGPSFHAQKAQFLYAQQQQQNQLQLLSQHHLVHSPKPKTAAGGSAGAGDEHLAMADQLSKAAELIETGSNPILAQGILARLNHQLTTTNPPPLHRACFYFKEALQLLVNGNSNPIPAPQQLSPFNLILKIGAHKTFSEISPAVQFANFTSNQAILEATDGFPAIHVVDFDIALGSQWASFMQELALRNHHTHTAVVSLKITAFASHEADLELGFTHDNLRQFAADLGLPFDLEILPLDALASWGPGSSSEAAAVAVNLPLAAFSSSAGHHRTSLLPLAVRFAKQLSPKILVAVERGCDSKAEAPFPVQVAHGLGAHAVLLESLDAVNAGPDAVQKIERALIQPGIEKMVLHGARRSGGAWRGLVASAGFTPASFSNFAESQAECLVQRAPARGFHVEKRQSSLVLCWQRKELITLSAWR